MKKLYAMVAMLFVTLAVSAQSKDSIRVRMDFNENPWNLPVSIPNYDLGEKVNWSKVDDETGCLFDEYTFTWPVGTGNIQVVLTPANPKLQGFHENIMVKAHDLNETGEPIRTMLWFYAGSQLTFKAPEGLWFAKVAIDTYRSWASGGLYSGDATDNQHVWGKDSVQVRYTYDKNGKLLYTQDCWTGDSVEWSLPENTGSTRLKYIDFWLLYRKGYSAGISQLDADAKSGDVYSFDGVLLRRDGQLNALPKGVYIVNRRKVVVK